MTQRLRSSVIKRRSPLLFRWDYRDGIDRDGQPITTDGVEGTGTRATIAKSIDSAGRVHNVALGQPRYYYSSAGVALGLLYECASTNICLRSQAFDNASWVSGGGGVTVAANSVAAPDGTVTAETLTAAGANGTLIQDLGVIGSAVKTFSIWLKRLTGTGNIDMTLDNGSTWTTKTITSSWARYSITQTLANPDCGIRIVTSGDAVYAWQGQVEALAFQTTDIETTGTSATRNQDQCEFPALWLPQNSTIYIDSVELGTFQATGSLLFQLGDNDSGTSSTAYLHCAAVGDVRLTYHNGTSSVTADVTTGAVASGDQHEIRACLLAAGSYVARSINAAAEVVGTPAAALAHPSSFAEQVLSFTPAGTFTGAHCIRSVKIAAGEQTLAYMRAA